MGYKLIFLKVVIFILGALALIAGLYYFQTHEHPTVQDAGKELRQDYDDKKAILNGSALPQPPLTEQPRAQAKKPDSKAYNPDIPPEKFLQAQLNNASNRSQ